MSPGQLVRLTVMACGSFVYVSELGYVMLKRKKLDDTTLGRLESLASWLEEEVMPRSGWLVVY